MEKKKKLNQQISTPLGTIVLIIIALTVGVFMRKVWKDQEAMEQSQNTIAVKKPVTQTIINQQNQTRPTTINNSKSTILVKINSDKKTWKNFYDKKSGIKLSYPSELSVGTSRKDIILGIYSISPKDAYYGMPDAMIMNQLLIYTKQESVTNIISEQKTNNPRNFTQKSMTLSDISAEQISYRGAYAGELWVDTLIKNGSDTIVISYPGDNPENVDIFEKIISTVHF
jgi:hypothetical protein